MDNDTSDPFFNFPNLHFPENTECRNLEFLIYPDSPDPVVVESIEDEESLPGWLTKDLTKQSSDGDTHGPVRGLRIVTLPIDLDEDHWDLQQTQRILKFLRKLIKSPRGVLLDEVFNASFVSCCYSACEENTQRYNGFVLQTPTRFVQNGIIIVLFDRQTCITHASLLSTNNFIGSDILSMIRKNMLDWTNPMAVLLEVVQLQFARIRESLYTLQCSLTDMNVRTGQYHYETINVDPVEHLLEINFMSTTKSLNTLSQQAVLESALAKSLLAVLENLRQFESATEEVAGEGSNTVKSLKINETMNSLGQGCRSLLLEAEIIQKRTAVLIRVVYQFMAQKDAKVNIELARSSAMIAADSKRDSSAMKTISVLGMLFLPGTFIAAVFAMPVFEWEANGAPIMKPAFKYYWAVTLPLTFMILFTWSMTMFLPWRKWISDWRNNPTRMDSEEGGRS